MKVRYVILVYLTFLLSSLLTMYFAGVGNARVMNQTSLFTCFCWDMCQIRFPQKLILVGVESIAVFILIKYYFKILGAKALIVSLIFAFVSVYVVEFLYSITELFDFHQQMVISGINYPVHVALGKFLVNSLILTLILVFVNPKKEF